MKKLAWVLVIVGALNWGLVGLGMLITNSASWNLVDMIFGSGVLSAIVYVLVGASGVYVLLGHCGCKGCMGNSCKDCANGTCQTHQK